MELYEEILINILKKQDIQVNFKNMDLNLNEIVESECYRALNEIKSIIENVETDDVECFQKIEEIVCLFEKLGSGGGGRHDF